MSDCKESAIPGVREMLAHIVSTRTAAFNEEKTGGLTATNIKFDNYMSVQRVSRSVGGKPQYPSKVPTPELPRTSETT